MDVLFGKGVEAGMFNDDVWTSVRSGNLSDRELFPAAGMADFHGYAGIEISTPKCHTNQCERKDLF